MNCWPVPSASISTTAPICPIPEEFLTEPEIEPGVTPASTTVQSARATVNHPNIRVISHPPNKGSPGPITRRTQPCTRRPVLRQCYSTAKRTDGAICCLDTLSSTFTVSLYTPG